MKIRLTAFDDIPALMEIFEIAKRFMRANGNHDQWINGYPSEEVLIADIAKGWSHIISDDDGKHILGTFCMMTVPDPTYSVIKGKWMNDKPYVTIHRIASGGTTKGLLKSAIEYAISTGKDVRIDTHADNLPMRCAVEKLGFKRCGIINIADGSERIAYQLINTTASHGRN